MVPAIPPDKQGWEPGRPGEGIKTAQLSRLNEPLPHSPLRRGPVRARNGNLLMGEAEALAQGVSRILPPAPPPRSLTQASDKPPGKAEAYEINPDRASPAAQSASHIKQKGS